jgi:hypothetical protein
MTKEIEIKIKNETAKPVSEKDELNKLEDDDEYEYVVVPPDGGFGWVVLIACFVSNYIEVIFFGEKKNK